MTADASDNPAAEQLSPPASVQHYWGDVLASFATGVQLDLRARLATEILKAPGVLNIHERPAVIVSFALTVAEEFVAQAGERGLLKELPDTGDLSRGLKVHLERNVRAQAWQQKVAQDIAIEEQRRVGVASADVLAANGRGRQ